jgi:hypothetical protein
MKTFKEYELEYEHKKLYDKNISLAEYIYQQWEQEDINEQWEQEYYFGSDSEDENIESEN